jgi:hypothetical protein
VIARRDAAFILSILPNNAFSDAGADSGRRGFIRYWALDRPARSRLWRELAAALRLGCARDRSGVMWVPSMSLHEDDPDDATYDGMALAIVPGAALRAAPSTRARVLATLHWDVLSVPQHDPGHGLWVHAWIAGNRDGYVRRDQIRAFTAYTAYFQKLHGRWQLAGFVTGQ